MELSQRLQKLENHIRERDYAGHCKYDALNSPILDQVCGKWAIPQIIATQIVNRTPFPLRNWLKVPKVKNPLGISNFLKGYALQKNKEKVEELAEWLYQQDSSTLGAYQGKGIAYGYPFPWASPSFYAPRHSPNCYVTCLV